MSTTAPTSPADRGTAATDSPVTPRSLAPAELHAQVQSGQLRAEHIVDVRTPGEFRAESIAGSRNLPLNNLDAPALATLRAECGGVPLVLTCASGPRAARAVRKLRDAGLTNIAVLEGGVDAWRQAGLAVARSGRGWSLERQVRVVAGALVLAGCALGVAVNPWFYALAALVGGGLVFAGVTNYCGMALLLGKLPWNR